MNNYIQYEYTWYDTWMVDFIDRKFLILIFFLIEDIKGILAIFHATNP